MPVLTAEDERAIAQAALAGWQFIPHEEDMDPNFGLFDVYDRDGKYYGINTERSKAARYAIAVMETGLENIENDYGARRKLHGFLS